MLKERFNPNNAELNKRRFQDLHSHILNAKNPMKKTKGARFTNKEVSLELSADEMTPEKNMQ